MNEEDVQKQNRDREEQSTQQRSYILGIRYFDLRDVEASLPLFTDLLTIEEMRTNKVIPLSQGDGRTAHQFGITSRTPQSFQRTIRERFEAQNENVVFFLISESGWRNMMLRYDPPKEVVYEDIKIASVDDKNTLKEVSDLLNNVTADKLLNFIIVQADKLGASDIHIETMHDKIRIRMRVDGALHNVAYVNKDKYRILIGELSSRSNLSMATNKPQSGNIQMDIVRDDGSRFMLNLRIETVPTMYGMDAVMRLFNFDESFLKLDLLGLDQKSRAEIESVISHPKGLVLVVGPTGSGKSTTLYSMLNSLNTVERKIITLEDPIEYGITGVTQIPIHSTEGGSFATGLRSILRLDPDVVMVGEIRDEDTAKTAIQASITGHLVLSTFHADSAASAFARLIDMIGVNPIFVSAIRMVVGQRLLRKLDATSREAYEPSEEEREWVIEKLADVPDDIKGEFIKDMKLYKPKPTKDNPFGYKGRIVVMEQLLVSDEVKHLIRGDIKDINAIAIEKAAKRNGMLNMMEKAVLLALKGQTTIEEINRVL